MPAFPYGKFKWNTLPHKTSLKVKGNMMSYTIRLPEGNLEKSLIVTRWVDEITGKSYKNVFAPGTRYLHGNNQSV